jgi:hypothetical protein
MARTGLRMMPTFPLSSLRFRTAGFPQYGSKAGVSDRAFPKFRPVKPAPSISGTRPRFASVLRARHSQRFCRRSAPSASCVAKHHHASDCCRSTPGALAPVRVMLSRSINAYPAPSAPLAGTSQLRRPAAYMRCLRCAGAPRRPASGSELSLPFFPSMSPSMSPGRLSLYIPSSFAISADLRREVPTARPLPMSTISRHTGSLSLQPAELLASLSEAFTSGLSTVRSPSPPPDMTTVSTGQSPPTGLSPARMAAKRRCTTSQVPGGPHYTRALLFDPGGTVARGHCCASMLPSAKLTASAPAIQ